MAPYTQSKGTLRAFKNSRDPLRWFVRSYIAALGSCISLDLFSSLVYFSYTFPFSEISLRTFAYTLFMDN